VKRHGSGEGKAGLALVFLNPGNKMKDVGDDSNLAIF
jgi:hypothetical protein